MQISENTTKIKRPLSFVCFWIHKQKYKNYNGVLYGFCIINKISKYFLVHESQKHTNPNGAFWFLVYESKQHVNPKGIFSCVLLGFVCFWDS